MNISCHRQVTNGLAEYWPALLKQKHLNVEARTLDGEAIKADPDPDYIPVIKSRDQEAEAVDASKWGETVRGPLGWIVHGRSGDKGGSKYYEVPS